MTLCIDSLAEFKTLCIDSLADFKTLWIDSLAVFRSLYIDSLAEFRTLWIDSLAEFRTLWVDLIAVFRSLWIDSLSVIRILRTESQAVFMTHVASAPLLNRSLCCRCLSYVAAQCGERVPRSDASPRTLPGDGSTVATLYMSSAALYRLVSVQPQVLSRLSRKLPLRYPCLSSLPPASLLREAETAVSMGRMTRV